MPVYKIIVEYDGTKFKGMQKQELGGKYRDNCAKGELAGELAGELSGEFTGEFGGIRTVQGELEIAIKRAFSDASSLSFCGRTDTGVHAVGQVCNFWTSAILQKNQVSMAINFHLCKMEMEKMKRERRIANEVSRATQMLRVSPEDNVQLDLRAVGDCVVGDDFHARFSCKQRIYQYKIFNRMINSPLFTNRMWHVNRVIDKSRASEVAKILTGRHDFSAFRASGCGAKSPIRTIDYIKISSYAVDSFPYSSVSFYDYDSLGSVDRGNCEADGGLNKFQMSGEVIIVEIAARSFLYRMVRNITGAIVDVAISKKTIEQVRDALDNQADSYNLTCAPASGLYFMEALY